MYNSYLGQQPQGQQGYQPQYQVPQQTGYSQPQQQQPQFQQQQQQPQFLQTQATGYFGGGEFQAQSPQPGQYGVPPVPTIPTQYAPQTPQLGMQPPGYQQPQQFQQMQQPLPQQQIQPPTPAISTPTGHQRSTSTSMGTSARIPNGLTPLHHLANMKFD
jgi:hypothetical protein